MHYSSSHFVTYLVQTGFTILHHAAIKSGLASMEIICVIAAPVGYRYFGAGVNKVYVGSTKLDALHWFVTNSSTPSTSSRKVFT